MGRVMSFSESLLQIMEEKNKTKRDIVIKKKFGNSSDKKSLGTPIYKATFEAVGENEGSEKLHVGVSYLDAGNYVLEWFCEAKSDGTRLDGELFHNNKEKKNYTAKKIKDSLYEFSGLEEIIFTDNGRQEINIELEDSIGKKAKVIRSVISLYKY